MTAAIASTAAPTEAFAQATSAKTYPIDISARTLPAAIAELSSETDSSIGTEGSLPILRTPRIKGRMSVEQALARLLAGSHYRARQVGARAWRIEQDERSPSTPSNLSRVRAAPSASLTPRLPPEPIIVTAAKRARSLQTLPLALSAVDMSGNEGSLPVSGTQWLAGEIEGLVLTSSGSGRNRMFLRGVADSPFNGESQSTVAVLLDDARVTYAAPDPDIRLVDVDRVEVLKGPQGSLYGIGALGGIYQVRTHRPELDTTSLSATAGLEGVSGGDAGIGGSAVANLPLAEGSVALRLVGYGMREPGWIDIGMRADSNSLRVSGARLGLGIVPATDWRLDLAGMVQRIESADSQYVYAPGARSRPAQLPEQHDNDLSVVSSHAAGALGSVHLELDSAYTWHEVHDTYDATIGAEGFGIADPQLLLDDRNYRLWDSEARLNGTLGGAEWLLGLSHTVAWQDAQVSLSADSIPTPAVLDDDRRSTTESALFGDASLPLGSQFRLEAGARLFAGTVKDSRTVGSELISRDHHRTGVTPSASIAWEPHEGRIVFLRYGSALRQGGVDIGSNGQLESYNGDELETFELGWRETAAAGGQIELSAYATRWKDMQADMLKEDRLIETQNVGEGRILGVEATWQQPLGRGWSMVAGATLTDAKLIRNDSNIVLDDTRLPVVPHFTVRGSLTREFTIGEAAGRIHLQLRYLGPSRLSFDPALDRKMGDVLESRLSAMLSLRGFDLALELENLFGRGDDTFAFGNQLRIFTGKQFTPQRPATAMLSVTRHF